MRYLMEFRQPAHAFVYDAKHPGIIEPKAGVTDYVVAEEPPAAARVEITVVDDAAVPEA